MFFLLVIILKECIIHLKSNGSFSLVPRFRLPFLALTAAGTRRKVGIKRMAGLSFKKSEKPCAPK
jgi:hypothetical protein